MYAKKQCPNIASHNGLTQENHMDILILVFKLIYLIFLDLTFFKIQVSYIIPATIFPSIRREPSLLKTTDLSGVQFTSIMGKRLLYL